MPLKPNESSEDASYPADAPSSSNSLKRRKFDKSGDEKWLEELGDEDENEIERPVTPTEGTYFQNQITI